VDMDMRVEIGMDDCHVNVNVIVNVCTV